MCVCPWWNSSYGMRASPSVEGHPINLNYFLLRKRRSRHAHFTQHPLKRQRKLQETCDRNPHLICADSSLDQLVFVLSIYLSASNFGELFFSRRSALGSVCSWDGAHCAVLKADTHPSSSQLGPPRPTPARPEVSHSHRSAERELHVVCHDTHTLTHTHTLHNAEIKFVAQCLALFPQSRQGVGQT